jgi:hypothetical protein
MGKKDKSREEEFKYKKSPDKSIASDPLSGKEGEDLFKIAFRNYLNLVALADRKAGLLIQVNTILASVVGAFGVKRIEVTPFYAFPTAAILLGSALTIFYSILASKPLEKSSYEDTISEKEEFFFGSFDRLDPEFKTCSWEKYSSDMNQFFKGEKRYIMDELIKESYEVRKVLSKKFGYLSIAYKIFFIGLLIGIFGFLVVLVYDFTHPIVSPGSPF